MDLTTTLAVSGAALAVAAFAGWRGARPPNPFKGPRLIPWRFIMVLAAAGALATLFTGLQANGIHPPGR
ncbi:hypothetical protein [Phenylobacterium sp.]|uniref:hypothetical protein n=1 Tax=Phenylobacterium sp. TaxID=1871053 RepID=UPI0025D535E6|nr:hypothetical protein [Phenylobacterium sp.]